MYSAVVQDFLCLTYKSVFSNTEIFLLANKFQK